MVILTEFYKTGTGKVLAGMDVIQSLKSLWLLSSSASTTLSSLGMKDVAKWQFMRRAHPPLAALSLMQFMAFLS